MDPLISRLIVMAFFSMLVNGTAINQDNVEIILLNESQYCYVNQNAIRVSDNFTSELQDIVNKSEHVIISTTINSTVIFITPSNGSRCNEEDLNGISKVLFTILIVISVITSLVVIANITLHLVFKELCTIVGIMIMILCGTMIVLTSISITSLIYGFISDGRENPTTCVVLTSIRFYVTLVYQTVKLVILFQFAYFMYKSYKLQSQDMIDKRSTVIKFVIFALTLSMLCFLSAIIIDLAVTGQFYSKRDSLYIGRQFDLDNVSVVRVVTIAELALFVIIQLMVFLLGFSLYILVNKSCCKTLSTNFRIVIALAATVGVNFILLVILNGAETSTNDSLPAISGGTLIEQLVLFLLFVSSSKVRNSLKKMLAYEREVFASTMHSRDSECADHNTVPCDQNFQ